MERTSTGIAAGLSLICSQSTPRKNGASLSSSIPLCAPTNHFEVRIFFVKKNVNFKAKIK